MIHAKAKAFGFKFPPKPGDRMRIHGTFDGGDCSGVFEVVTCEHSKSLKLRIGHP